MIDAADKGGLTGTGGPDDDQLFSFSYRQVNILLNLQITEILFKMFYFYHISHISHRLPSCVPERAAFLKNKILKIKARNKKKATAQREQLSFSTIAFFS